MDKRIQSSISGVYLPHLIYGTAWKKSQTEALVIAAVTAGFRGIDTACQPKHYNEAQVGSALTKLLSNGFQREEIFLQTKFTPLDGQDPERIPYDPQATLDQQVAQSFAVSQQNLNTDYVDSLVLHSPLSNYQDLLSVWRSLEAIAQHGGAKQLGISNCYQLSLLQQLYQEAQIKPAVVQNRFYADTGYDVDIRQWCSTQGIIYQSFWTLTANPHLLKHAVIQELSEKYRATPAQVFFRFLSHIGIIPLSGTTSLQHMKEDLDVLAIELDPDEIRQINKLLNSNPGS